MNLDIFYINDTETILIEHIKNKDTYYGNFYEMFSGNISIDDYLKKLKVQFLSLNSYKIKLIVLKILKNVLINHLGDFENIKVKNYETIGIDLKKMQENNFEIENLWPEIFCPKRDFPGVNIETIIEIYEILNNDMEKLCHYYYLYFKNIIDNFEIDKHPIELIILDKNKVFIYEGTHRFIICIIKNICHKFNIKESKYKIYDDIDPYVTLNSK